MSLVMAVAEGVALHTANLGVHRRRGGMAQRHDHKISANLGIFDTASARTGPRQREWRASHAVAIGETVILLTLSLSIAIY